MTEPLVTAATFSSSVEAEVARNVLEDAGIPAFLADTEVTAVLGLPGPALGTVKLLVAEADLERAREILDHPAELDPEDYDDYGLERRRGRGGRPAVSVGDEEEVESPADAWARRAWRSAVIGLLICPGVIHCYSAWALMQIDPEQGGLSPAGKKAQNIAFLINCVVFGALLLVLGSFFLGLLSRGGGPLR